jgi:hypothetical protein
MAHSHSTATPEATKTSAIAHPPVPDVQKASESEIDRSGMLEARAFQAIGGGSFVTSPEQYAGALGQLSGQSQTSLLRQLQRSYGNSYVGSVIQAKLTVNQPGDIYEQEADRMAAQVVMPKPELPITPVASVSQPLGEMGIQRQCSECQQGMEEGKDSDEMSSGAGIQRQLTVGAVGDRYEQEADRVAAQVMRMSVAPDNSPQMQRFGEEDNPVQRWSLAQSITPLVQRQVDEQVQMRELVQRAFQAGGNQASGDLEDRLNASKGGGSALAPEVRAFMEPRFGADFSSVRVHTGSEAVQMNRELGAQAFAHGSDVYFGAGKSPGNNELTAHELTHVVQQTGGVQRLYSEGEAELLEKKEKQSAHRNLTLGQPGDRYEQETVSVAPTVVKEINVPGNHTLQRLHPSEEELPQQPTRLMPQDTAFWLPTTFTAFGGQEGVPWQRSVAMPLTPTPTLRLQRSFDPLESIPVLGKFWKYIKCSRSTAYVAELKKECMNEYQAKCKGDITSDDCMDFIGSAGYISDAINNCVKKKDPDAWKDFLTNCAKSAAAAVGSSK